MKQRLLFELLYLKRDPPWDSGISPPELIQYLHTKEPGRALDLGCGTGTNAINIARKGWEVVAVDLSYLAIRLAQKKATDAGTSVTFKRGDVTQLDWIEDPFDLILDIGCFHALSPAERIRYSRQVKRLSIPGTDLLLYSFLNEEISPSFLRSTFTPEFEITSADRGVDQATSGQESIWVSLKRMNK